MHDLFEAMVRNAERNGKRLALSDGTGSLSRIDLLRRVGALAEALESTPRVIGLLAPNGMDWVVAQLACAMAGKITVPLPTFFSAAQLEHIVSDASVEMLLTTAAMQPLAARIGPPALPIDDHPPGAMRTGLTEGFGQIIYTSGSTGHPKGVRHESGQVAWSARTLAEASGAAETDRFFSVLPLPLLLETICAVFVPQLVGGQSHFDRQLADAAVRGQATGLALAFEEHRPTASVIVPQLLKVWIEELRDLRREAPASLRFVAAGGAPMPACLAAEAWQWGIPVHEGYGLSECCSVVSLNRPGQRTAGTSGPPLPGLTVTIDRGEIVVDGPSITDGYLGQPAAARPWRTGDLGSLDANGCVIVHGRKDDLIVTSYGRNVNPEWIETMLLGDPRIARCAVTGHGEPFLTAVLVPSRAGTNWFGAADRASIDRLVADRCDDAPLYAIPRAFVVTTMAELQDAGLLTSNGRFIRRALPDFVARRTAATMAKAS